MTACLLPSAAFATGAEPAAQPAAAQGETVDNATDTAKDTPQNKPENNAGDKTASAATDNAGNKTASTATDSTGDKTASAATDNVGNKTAATAADNTGDKTGDTTEDTTGTQGEPDGAPVATALNSLAAAPAVTKKGPGGQANFDGPGPQIYFFIAEPGEVTTMPTDKDSYYFLTGGGQAADKAREAFPDTSAPAAENQTDPSVSTQYVKTFEKNLRLNRPEGTSTMIGEGSTWEINEKTGEVTRFSLQLGDTPYTSDDYRFQWVKFSCAYTTDQHQHSFHMDGKLYKKVKLGDIIKKLAPTKTTDGAIYDTDGRELKTFTFQLTMPGNDQFEAIPMSATVTGAGASAPITLDSTVDKKQELQPGTYVITEVQTDEQKKAWAATSITFHVYSNGEVAVANGSNKNISNTQNIYTLTYDGNVENDTVNGLPQDVKKYRYNQIATISTQKPTREGYWFKGWNTQPDGSGTPYEGGQQTQIQGNVTLYAQWELMYDFTLRPANMTIYVGGSGDAYGGIVDGKGNSGKGDNSLPEPGFYFTLPDEVNEELNQALGEGDKAAVDLSRYVTVTATADDGSTRSWKLEPYGSEGEDSSSTAILGEDGQERFVYRIVPNAGQDPIRVQIKNGDTVVTSDKEFEPSEALYAEYTVSLYTGTLKPEDIVMTITVDQADSPPLEFRCQYNEKESKPGTLTVRHASENAPTTRAAVGEDALADKIKQEPDSFHVQVEDTQTFYLNETDHDTQGGGITVAHNDVSLLADTLVSGDNYEFLTALDEKAQTKAGFTNAVVDRAYLDLVDAENGNAWLTAEGKVKVFWPYRNGMNQNSTLKLYHFEGLDRNMTTESLLDRIAKTEATPVHFTQDEHGITFETDSFSPFVLVCDTTPAPQPSTGDGSSDKGSSQSSTVTVTATAPTPTPAPAAKPAAAVVIPQTGDEMPVGLLAGLAIVAAGGLAALLVLRKRRSDR